MSFTLIDGSSQSEQEKWQLYVRRDQCDDLEKRLFDREGMVYLLAKKRKQQILESETSDVAPELVFVIKPILFTIAIR